MTAASFDATRARLAGPDMFARFVVQGEGTALAREDLPGDHELLVAKRGERRIAFAVREIARPHLAQGELGGDPYLVTF